MQRLRIVVTEPIRDTALQRLQARHDVLEIPHHDATRLGQALAEASALIVRSYTRVTAELIAAAPRLRVVARAGSGVENIDVAAARAAGVSVVYRPSAATTAVAELTIGFLLSLERRLPEGAGEIAAGRFLERRNDLSGRLLAEMTLGIVGYGRIGSRVAEMCHRAFDMSILYHDIREVRPRIPARCVPLVDLLAAADVVSLHVPLTGQTRHLIDAAALQGMRPGALLINTARGAVIDGAAVAAALRSGCLGGAAIDVFEPEPPGPQHPLLGAPRCILTPHIAARSPAALAAMSDVVDDVLAVLDGNPPQFPFIEDWS